MLDSITDNHLFKHGAILNKKTNAQSQSKKVEIEQTICRTTFAFNEILEKKKIANDALSSLEVNTSKWIEICCLLF